MSAPGNGQDIPKKLGLVFGGGVMKGICHAGAYAAIERLKIKPDIVVGTSAGSLFGALVAAGYSSSEIADVVLQTKFDEKLLDPRNKLNHNQIIQRVASFKSWVLGCSPMPIFLAYPILRSRLNPVLRLRVTNSIYKGEALETWVNDLLAAKLNRKFVMFEDMPNFAVVTTDLPHSTPKVFVRGNDEGWPVARAVLASCSVPFVFPGIESKVLQSNKPGDPGWHLYLDGGFMNRLPISVALDLGATRVIAFQLGIATAFDVTSVGGFASATYEAASSAPVSGYRGRPDIHIIEVDHPKLSPWDFGASPKLKTDAMQSAYLNARQRLEVLQLQNRI
jgi:predicted acylesterase/phospholipase RssA